jgi:hypothetical protein
MPNAVIFDGKRVAQANHKLKHHGDPIRHAIKVTTKHEGSLRGSHYHTATFMRCDLNHTATCR